MPRGGARPGAGRKPKPKPDAAVPKGFTEGDGSTSKVAPADWPFGTKPPTVTEPPADLPAAEVVAPIPAGPEDETPLAAMLRIMRAAEDPRIALQAAVAAAPYLHAKRAPISAKGGHDAEKKPSRFSVPAAPRLVSSR
jgi:hypothetical protein